MFEHCGRTYNGRTRWSSPIVRFAKFIPILLDPHKIDQTSNCQITIKFTLFYSNVPCFYSFTAGAKIRLLTLLHKHVFCYFC